MRWRRCEASEADEVLVVLPMVDQSRALNFSINAVVLDEHNAMKEI
jgi:hypothetical protein